MPAWTKDGASVARGLEARDPRISAILRSCGIGLRFTGPVEADETYMGGKRKNMSNAKRKALQESGPVRGPAGKTIVDEMKDRDSNQVAAMVVESANKVTLQGFIGKHVMPGSEVYTDEAAVYEDLPYPHKTVTWTATCRSSRPGTTSATPTPSTRCGPWWKEWRRRGCGTAS